MVSGVLFLFNNVLLGWGLAMDAFSVSIVNGLHEPDMRYRKRIIIAGTFAFFQWFMPMLGWICVRTVLYYFKVFEKFIPWIALVFLAYIGGTMIIEGLRKDDEKHPAPALSYWALFIQGVATSIDALSVGLAIAEYRLHAAFIASLIIAGVTFVICMGGLHLGRIVGKKISDKATILGGIILIGIGIEVFISHMF